MKIKVVRTYACHFFLFKSMRLAFILLLFAYPELVAQSLPQDFFLNDSQPKAASIPGFNEVEKPTQSPTTTTIDVNLDQVITPVSKYVYGNNVNPYMTQIVGDEVLLNYIKDLAPQVIRFPGGNLSSVYFWGSEKNSPPADAPAKLVDGNGTLIDPGYWYGKNTEGWTLSVDNYYNMLEQTGNTGMITINYGYARYSTAENPVASAAHYAAEWVRHDNGKTKFWEIGNESNGNWQAGFRIETANNKDGQPEIITGDLYGKHFKVFADSMRKAADEIGATIYIGAQLLAEAPASWWNATDRNWNAGVLSQAGPSPDFYIIHSYYTPFAENTNATSILNTARPVTEDMMHFVTDAVTTAGLPMKPVALTEWNIFAEGSKQQVSYINGIHSAIVLGELIKNKYGMASRWNLANSWSNGNDHGMFSQGGEPGVSQWSPRPAFYYMYYFQRFFGDKMVNSSVNGGDDNILAYASTFSSGESSVVIVNKGQTNQIAQVNLFNAGIGERYYFYTLTGGNDNGEFSLKVKVNDATTVLNAGGPSNYKTLPARSAQVAGGIKLSLPPRSVTYVLVDKGNSVITDIIPEQEKIFPITPNPSRGKFTVLLQSRGYSKIEMIDVGGRVVYQMPIDSKIGQFQVDSGLPEGLYILRAYGRGKIVSEKVLIIQN